MSYYYISGSWKYSDPATGAAEDIGDGFDVQERTGAGQSHPALPAARGHLEKYPGAAAFFRYRLTRHWLVFTNYADPDVLETDRKIMKAYMQEAPPPEKKAGASDQAQQLPHPAYFRPSAGLFSLSHLLYWCFGVLRMASFLDLFEVPLKPVPSKGARHPFEAYLLVAGNKTLKDGLYRYDAEAHGLLYLRPAGAPTPSGTWLIITCLFEKVQWRYRDESAYQDLQFDYGHLLANFKLVAAELGIGWHRHSAGDPAVLETPLREEIMDTYQLTIR